MDGGAQTLRCFMKPDESGPQFLNSMQLHATAMTLVSYTPAAGPSTTNVISGQAAGEDGVGREQGFHANRKSSPVSLPLKVEQVWNSERSIGSGTG